MLYTFSNYRYLKVDISVLIELRTARTGTYRSSCDPQMPSSSTHRQLTVTHVHGDTQYISTFQLYVAQLSPAMMISLPRVIEKNNNQLSISEKGIKIITDHCHLSSSEQNPPKRTNSPRGLIRPQNLQENFLREGSLGLSLQDLVGLE